MLNPLAQRLIQSLPVPKDGRVAELGFQTWTKPDNTKVSAEEFYKALGWSVYQAYDISNKWGARQVDLNYLPSGANGGTPMGLFDLVTNNGTGEHIFNQASVFQWAHDLCKPGGVMLHILPWVGWLNHGFYSFHPIIFRDLAEANGYRLESLFVGERNGRLDRIDQGDTAFHHPKPHKEPWTQIERLVKTYGERANIFVCAVLRKTKDEPFKYPTQGKYQKEMNEFATPPGFMLLTAHAAARGTIHTEPFPYVVFENALPPDLYAQLAAKWPDFPYTESDPEIGNTLHQLSCQRALGAGVKPVADVDGLWTRFLLDHSNAKWFMQLSNLFGDSLKPLMSKMKDGDLSIGVRNTGNFDINLDVQLAINSPVKSRSRVRGPHVDSADEIMAGMLYMPLNEDTAGGDLILYRWKDAATRALIGKAEIRDSEVEEFARVPYRPNTAIFFVNGSDVIHGVDYREPTNLPRRYVNFLVNASKPLIQYPERVNTDDWKGIRKAHQR